MADFRNRIVGSGERPARDFTPNPLNWRLHPAVQQAALKGALTEVGWVQNVIVNKTTGNTIDGHARIELAEPDDLIPYVEVELSEEEERYVLATLDPITGLAETNEDRLDALLATVRASDAAVAELLAGMGSGAQEPFEGVTDPDDVPEVTKEEPYVKVGDVWALGDHRLVVGDCTDPAIFAACIGPDDRIDLIATDPPYGIDYVEVARGRSSQHADWEDIHDDDDAEKAAALTRTVLLMAKDHAADACAVFVWHPWGRDAGKFIDAAHDADILVHKAIVWVKPSPVFSRHEYHPRYEQCLYGWFHGHRAAFYGDRTQTTVWEVGRDTDTRHPTQKPSDLWTMPIENHTLRGGIVFDPFAGSGTAVIASQILGRSARVIEYEPAYGQVIIERWQDFTGEKAKRLTRRRKAAKV